jgi:uncharacterized protein (TIGR03435 family)
MKPQGGLFRILLPFILFGVSAAFPQGQSQPAPASPARLEFDVASIRPSPPLDMTKLAAEIQAGHMPRFGANIDASLAEYRYMTLKALIANAYSLKEYQVDGPAWLGQERFDIEARMPAGAAKTDAPQMLQALLADRFGLVARHDTSEQRVLALVVAKYGPKLQPALAAPAPIDENAPLKPGEMKINTPQGPAILTRNHDGSMTINMGERGTITQKFDMQAGVIHMNSSTVSMSGFADMLTNVLQMGGAGGRQVVDKTGLQGNYQVSLDISLSGVMEMARQQGLVPPPSPASGTDAGKQMPTASDPGNGSQTIYQSVEKLGLKLEDRKASVERLVVDKVNKDPTPN